MSYKNSFERANKVRLNEDLKYTLQTLAIKRQKQRMQGIKQRPAPFSMCSFLKKNMSHFFCCIKRCKSSRFF